MPFKHQPLRSRRERAARFAGGDINDYFEFAILRVKVWRSVISEIHVDHNSKETAEFGHSETLPRSALSVLTAVKLRKPLRGFGIMVVIKRSERETRRRVERGAAKHRVEAFATDELMRDREIEA